MRISWVCALVLLVTACGGSEPVRIGRSSTSSVPLVPTPPKVLRECQRFTELQPACPAKVPAVEDATFKRSHASSEDEDLWIFFAEWNAPHPALTERNAPPAFAHLNVFVGDVQKMAGFQIDRASEEDPPKKRASALSFGERTWKGRTGDLLLAPSYPQGGMEGDHLVFRWTQEDVDYSLSLHAWVPLEETEATLKTIVESLP